MKLRLTHDDRLRAIRAAAVESDPPVQLNQHMINRAVAVRPNTLLRFRQAHGAQRRFRALAQTVATLPEFARTMR